jgi:hypothetical protein
MKPEKEIQLQAFLSHLPDKMAVQLALAIERDRVSGGHGLPHEMILSGLRGSLVKLSPPRTPTPLRLFCEPFEDLLVTGARRVKQPGRISRGTLRPLWTWLGNDLLGERLNAYEAAISAAVIRGDFDARTATVRQLQHEAASAIMGIVTSIEPGGRAGRELEARLGGPGSVADVREIALLLEVAEEVNALRVALPRPIESLNEEHLALIRDAYDRFSSEHPDQAPYIALVVMGRLVQPWEALRLAGVVSRKNTDTVIAATDLGVVGDVLLSDAEGIAEQLASMRQPDFDVGLVASLVSRFARLTSGLTKELGIKREGQWGQRLMKSRSTVSHAVEAMLERAPKEIMAALPVHRVGGFGSRGPRRPDVTKEPDLEKVARAERYAQLLNLTKPYSSQAAFTAASADAFEEVTSQLRTYCEEILTEVRASTPDQRARTEAHLGVAVRLAGQIFGPEEGELLRRRGTAATAR